ncbi:MAG: Fur family transcriptional regulator [Peptococcia bacterium]|jgi:Fur family peroxide stress response transcriptional regulator
MMEQLHKLIAEKLKKHQIKPSVHRIMVYEYLMTQQNHPTVEQIFLHLRQDFPTISKATIYNTLNLFVEVGLVRDIAIEDKENRYDANVQNHGHFKCEACGKVYDFKVEIDSLPVNGLVAFQIKNKDVFFKGLCPDCH